MVSLKLYDPDHRSVGDRGLTAASTLTELFEGAYVPVVCDGRLLDAKTIQLYREAVSWWRRLTDDPPLNQITDEVAARFVKSLESQPGRRCERLAIATVRKHAKAIDTLLRFAGPRARTRVGRHNRELLATPPWLEIPRPDVQPVVAVWTEAELAALLGAVGQMPSPRIEGVSPGEWWRALIEVAVYTGLRLGQLLGLRYEDLRRDGERGWIAVRAGCSKGRRGKVQFLTAPALAAVERIRTPRAVIFSHPSWPRNPRYLQACLKRLAAVAGVPETRRWGFHAFRRTHATLLALSCGSRDDAWETAQASLGHANLATTRDYYGAQSAKEALLAASLCRLPTIGTVACAESPDGAVT